MCQGQLPLADCSTPPANFDTTSEPIVMVHGNSKQHQNSTSDLVHEPRGKKDFGSCDGCETSGLPTKTTQGKHAHPDLEDIPSRKRPRLRKSQMTDDIASPSSTEQAQYHCCVCKGVEDTPSENDCHRCQSRNHTPNISSSAQSSDDSSAKTCSIGGNPNCKTIASGEGYTKNGNGENGVEETADSYEQLSRDIDAFEEKIRQFGEDLMRLQRLLPRPN